MEEEPKTGKELAQQVLFPDLITSYREGRDELNLAEFPISSNRKTEDEDELEDDYDFGTKADPPTRFSPIADTPFRRSADPFLPVADPPTRRFADPFLPASHLSL
jgi:hypothetical protein